MAGPSDLPGSTGGEMSGYPRALPPADVGDSGEIPVGIPTGLTLLIGGLGRGREFPPLASGTKNWFPSAGAQEEPTNGSPGKGSPPTAWNASVVASQPQQEVTRMAARQARTLGTNGDLLLTRQPPGLSLNRTDLRKELARTTWSRFDSLLLNCDVSVQNSPSSEKPQHQT